MKFGLESQLPPVDLSDHGYSQGQFRLCSHKMQVYDHGTRVPALFRGKHECVDRQECQQACTHGALTCVAWDVAGPGIKQGLQLDAVIGAPGYVETTLRLLEDTALPG